MPVYEYRCTSCEERTEAQQHVGDPPLSKCPRCGGVLERVVSAPALQFKGSGFYVTDYARRGANSASSKDETGGTAKPEATPAKAESAPPDKGTKKDKTTEAG